MKDRSESWRRAFEITFLIHEDEISDDEIDILGDEMEVLWDELTVEEKKELNHLSGDLNEFQRRYTDDWRTRDAREEALDLLENCNYSEALTTCRIARDFTHYGRVLVILDCWSHLLPPDLYKRLLGFYRKVEMTRIYGL